jgi:hypothetical protein
MADANSTTMPLHGLQALPCGVKLPATLDVLIAIGRWICVPLAKPLPAPQLGRP